MTSVAVSRKISFTVDDAAILIAVAVTMMLACLFTYTYQACGASIFAQIGEKLTKASGVLVFMWPFNFFAALLMVQFSKQAPRQFKPRFILALLPVACSAALLLWSVLKWHLPNCANCAFDDGSSWQVASSTLCANTVVPTVLVALFKGHRLFFLGYFALIFSTLFAASLLAGYWL